MIQAQVRSAGIIEVWGATKDINVQGERVQKLDRIANDIFIDVMKRSGSVAAMASEEEHDIIEVPPNMAGNYVVLFDPLDGSTNIDANVTIGTIFSIYRRCREKEVIRRDVLRPGREQVAAGYILYGSSTLLLYSDGHSVNCFTLDPSAGEYFLTRPDITMPNTTKILSLNECNEPYWPDWVKPYVNAVKSRNNSEKRRISSRHIGSLVADFHRNLIYGGVYLYPADARCPKGKLRVLYECSPLAFIAETAGGAASTGSEAILDIKPESLHQRTSLIIGPQEDVAQAEKFVAQHN